MKPYIEEFDSLRTMIIINKIFFFFIFLFNCYS